MFSASNASVQRATLIGLFAPICWGMSVSLIRGIAEGFGLAQGQTLLYLVATLCLFFTIGLPRFDLMDKRYLFIAIPTANLSSLSFCLAIFTSDGGAQTMEVGMVNLIFTIVGLPSSLIECRPVGGFSRGLLWPLPVSSSFWQAAKDFPSRTLFFAFSIIRFPICSVFPPQLPGQLFPV